MLFATKTSYEKAIDLKISHPSYILLQDKISTFYEEPFSFPNHGCDLVWPSSDIVNVCFYGDIYSSFLLVKHWPKNKKYRLYCLSNKMRKAISKIFKIEESSLDVIDRYKIFPRSTQATPFYSLSKDPLTFVISSSYGKIKNIDLTINLINRWQREVNNRVMLSICGPRKDYELIEKELEKYRWITTPLFLKDLGMNWANESFINPLLINLSTSLFEYFGVSIAQAQVKGWPLIISDWGGHSDVTGSNVLKIPIKNFGLHFDRNLSLEERTQSLYDYLTTVSVEDENNFSHIKYDGTLFEYSDLNFINENYRRVFSNQCHEIYKTSLYNRDLEVVKIIEHCF